MNGLGRLILAATLGGLVAMRLPREGLLSASQELIGFLSLIMAGLLPAMILTATILRGDGFSAKRVADYGAALKAQLRFWAVLFLFAGVATAAVVGAKMFSGDDATFRYHWRSFSFDNKQLSSLFVALLGGGVGVVLQRLHPAYVGLVSLLDLNVSMASAQAASESRRLAAALEADIRNSKAPEAYAKFSTIDPDRKSA